MSTALQDRHTAEQQREDAILDVATALVLAHGYDGLSFDQLAKDAHVSKATLYGRWPGKPALVLAVIRREAAAEPDDLDRGSLRADLLALGENLRRDHARAGQLVLALAQAIRADPDVAAAVEEHLSAPHRERSRQILLRAVRRGELPRRALTVPYALDLLPALSVATLLLAPGDELDVAAVVDRVVLPVLTQYRSHR